MGLPNPSFTQIRRWFAATFRRHDPTSSAVAVETTLDVVWAHRDRTRCDIVSP